MRAARRMDVMIARPPAEERRINPALHLERRLARLRIHDQREQLRHGLRPAREGDGIAPCRQPEILAIAPIHLVLEEEVWLQPLRAQRIHPPRLVTNLEGRHRCLPVLVPHSERHRLRFHTIEEHIRLAAKAQVLRALPGVEGDLPLPFPGVAAEELDDSILQRQTAQRLAQRLLVEHRQVHPQVFQLWRIILISVERAGGRGILASVAFPGRERVGADRDQGRRGAGFILHLHEKGPPALLHQLRFRRALPHLHAHLRIDVHLEEHARIQHLLDRGGVLRHRSDGQRGQLGIGQRRADAGQRIRHALNLRVKWLPLDVRHHRERRGGEEVGGEGERGENNDHATRKGEQRFHG